MKKTLLTIFFLAALPLAAHADYSITTNNNTTDYQYYSSAGGYYDKAAQSFTTIGAGTVSSVSICLKNTGEMSGTTEFTLESDNAGKPADDNLGTGSISNSSITNTDARNAVSFAGATVAASTKYWIVFSSTVQSNSLTDCGTVGGLVNGGHAWYLPTNGGWYILSTDSQTGMTVYITTSGGGGGSTTPMTGAVATTTNPYIGFISSYFIFLMELTAFLIIMFLFVMAIGYPVRSLARAMLNLIRRA